MKILVLGYIIRAPFGGLCFHHLQYILTLKQLGHQVLFYEDSDDYPGIYNEKSLETAEIFGLKFITELFNYYQLKDQWAFFDSHSNTWYGLSARKVLAFCQQADIVLNLSGVNVLRDWWADIPARVFIDTDPVFNQIKHLVDENKKELAGQHTCHFSFAENIARKNNLIPKDGFDWKPTRQPVVIEIWRNSPPVASGKWTTVMQWDSYGTHSYNGQSYGMKADSFGAFIKLPEKVSAAFELAIKADENTTDTLNQEGWSTISSLVPTKDSFTYQKYISQSKGEWSVAKHGYVISNSGWFSERSLGYMASWRPVVVQDTGFSDFLPVGQGLLCFSSLEQAADQINRVNADYEFHCKKAREIVEAHFNGKVILTSLLNNIT